MDVHRLLGDELSYELALRGISADNRTVVEKRDILRGLLRCEKDGVPGTIVTDHLVVDTELGICQDKLSDLSDDIRQFDHRNTRNEFRRINSRLLHIAGRLSRLSELSETQNAAKEQLVSSCMQLMSSVVDLRDNPPEMGSILDQPTPNITQNPIDEPNLLLPDIQNLTIVDTVPPGDLAIGDTMAAGQRESSPGRPAVAANVLTSPTAHRVHFSENRGASSPMMNLNAFPVTNARRLALPSQELHYFAPTPVSKWNLTFDGSRSVTDFLDRVQELCESRHVPRQQLFQSAVELFTGDALIWFRSIRHSVRTWSELEVLLKMNFLPYDYETKLWNEIRRRSQGADEKVVVYIAVMENLFNKLPTKPSELERIRVIRNNLLPYFQSLLALSRVRSLPELIQVCRSLEEANHCAEQFRPPPNVSRYLLEPELAYKRPASARVAAVSDTPHHVDTSTSEVRLTMGNNPVTAGTASSRDLSVDALQFSPGIASITCWNCQQTGHRSSECGRPKTKHCYRCGRPNYTTKTCPKCSGNAAGSLQ